MELFYWFKLSLYSLGFCSIVYIEELIHWNEHKIPKNCNELNINLSKVMMKRKISKQRLLCSLAVIFVILI